jgi:DNA-binding transcriptional LysR family regulator
MKRNRFLLSSEDCELLLEFETCQTIEKTAEAIAKDPSGVSRQLAGIAKKYPALEKRGGRWILTSVGKRLNSQTRDSIQYQNQLAQVDSVVRIGTNREFAARVIGPDFSKLASLFPQSKLMLFTFEHGTEEALLTGKIDLGIDCERPGDPDIAYRQLIPEPIVAVCSKEFKKKYDKEIRADLLYQTPHLLCERLYPDKIFLEQDNKLNVVALFNDIATTRAACLTGIGWSLLPRYAVRDELDRKELFVIGEKAPAQAKYGVWWSRSRYSKSETISKMCDWLKAQEL